MNGDRDVWAASENNQRVAFRLLTDVVHIIGWDRPESPQLVAGAAVSALRDADPVMLVYALAMESAIAHRAIAAQQDVTPEELMRQMGQLKELVWVDAHLDAASQDQGE